MRSTQSSLDNRASEITTQLPVRLLVQVTPALFAAVFFVAFILLGSVFISSLFVGLVVDRFVHLYQRLRGESVDAVHLGWLRLYREVQLCGSPLCPQ